MLGLMKKELEYKNIPYGYEHCFNEDCQLRDKCMHYQVYLLKPDERLVGPTVYPSAWKSGKCLRFSEVSGAYRIALHILQRSYGLRHYSRYAACTQNCHLHIKYPLFPSAVLFRPTAASSARPCFCHSRRTSPA